MAVYCHKLSVIFVRFEQKLNLVYIFQYKWEIRNFNKINVAGIESFHANTHTHTHACTHTAKLTVAVAEKNALVSRVGNFERKKQREEGAIKERMNERKYQRRKVLK